MPLPETLPLERWIGGILLEDHKRRKKFHGHYIQLLKTQGYVNQT